MKLPPHQVCDGFKFGSTFRQALASICSSSTWWAPSGWSRGRASPSSSLPTSFRWNLTSVSVAPHEFLVQRHQNGSMLGTWLCSELQWAMLDGNYMVTYRVTFNINDSLNSHNYSITDLDRPWSRFHMSGGLHTLLRNGGKQKRRWVTFFSLSKAKKMTLCWFQVMLIASRPQLLHRWTHCKNILIEPTIKD